MDCVFCKIINKQLAAEIIFENDQLIVFQDIQPVAPVHILIVPKKHISSINHLENKDKQLIGELFLVAQEIAQKKKVAQTGYRLIFNVGQDAGQTVDHLHLHLIGGEKLPFA
jgi:histidine triad (HIT) family protein